MRITKEGPQLLGEIVEERRVLGNSCLEKKGQYAVHCSHPRHPPNEGTSVEGQLWKYGERAIVQKPITSALNARSWQSGCINEGVTPEQSHAAHCNSQQMEGSVGWDKHSSGDLRNRQMDSQDEGSRRIYIIREISRRGGRQFGRY